MCLNRSHLCVLAILLFLCANMAFAGSSVDGVQIIFMEVDTTVASDSVPTYRIIDDTKNIEKYSAWLNNEPAKIAIDLFKRTWALTEDSSSTPIYHVALVKGGNYADLGFKLRMGKETVDHGNTAYIKLGPEEWVFTTTFLHETGHVILSMLNSGEGVPASDLSSIPHTTAALSSRGTAFNEGFSVHLETLAAHLGNDPTVQQRYLHPTFLFGIDAGIKGEYFRQSADLLSYAQTRTRYYDVRENHFAFASACKEPDYLRVQLDKSRDFGTLRDANQLLQSEGFYATFFFDLLVAGNEAPTLETIHARQVEMLAALKEMFSANQIGEETPYLLDFVRAYAMRFPERKGAIIDLLLDSSHGVFSDENAAKLWSDHYMGALRLDLAERKNDKIVQARTTWKTEAMENFDALYKRLGPQIRCEVDSVTVGLIAFGEEAPLIFDVNTVEIGIMRLIPGISEPQIKNWIDERQKLPFRDENDFKSRCKLEQSVLAQMKIGSPGEHAAD